MAHDPLTEPLRSIEAGSDELTRYRARLGERLGSEPPRRRTLRRGLLAAAAAVVVGLLAWTGSTRVKPKSSVEAELATANLPELERLAETASPDALRSAERLAGLGDTPEAWNGRMLLCLAETPERAVDHATVGVHSDPRPEFRFRYLEVLLDEGDERQYDAVRVERWMDRETDPGCLRLYRRLLSLSA